MFKVGEGTCDIVIYCGKFVILNLGFGLCNLLLASVKSWLFFNLIFNIFDMLDIRFKTLEGRKKAFLDFYSKGKDITEIANLLGIEVHHSNKLPDKTLGAIQYDDESKKFQMIINVKNKINTITSKSRVLMTVAHEVAHWVYDYDDMKNNGKVLCKTDSLNVSDKMELIASVVASNIMLCINEPLIDEKQLSKFLEI
jgi:hypothetical protein